MRPFFHPLRRFAYERGYFPRGVVGAFGQFPHFVSIAAENRRPHMLAAYANETASLFNMFYRDCQVLQAEEPLRSARLALVDISRVVLRNALDCIGLRAPAEM